MAECLVCGATCPASSAERCGWQRGACTCQREPRCPTGALWLCPDHRTDRRAA